MVAMCDWQTNELILAILVLNNSFIQHYIHVQKTITVAAATTETLGHPIVIMVA